MSIPIAPSISATSPSSPGSNVDDDPNLMQSAWQESPTATPGSQAAPRATPLQKRRRVTRACDECRRKKIKCDGKQPCTHCTVYSYGRSNRAVSGKYPKEIIVTLVADCSYDQPSNRRRNPAPQYIESLETRLARAEALLKRVLPDVDLNDPNIDATIARQSSHAKTSQGRAAVSEAEQDAQLSSMIAMTGQLDLDEHGRWDFHVSIGRLFLVWKIGFICKITVLQYTIVPHFCFTSFSILMCFI